MVKIGVLELNGYREWTESIGFDREWIIQTIQANIYKLLQEEISRLQGFVMPLRYDYMVLVIEGVDNSSVVKTINKVSKVLPVPVRLSIACGKTPYQAQVNATRRLVEGDCNICVEECDTTGIAVAHFDVNNFSKLIHKLSVYDTFVEVENLCVKLSKEIRNLGGLTQYLGGDNILSFISIDMLDRVKELANSIPGLKVGIGVSNTAKGALRLASRALDSIRSNRCKECFNYLVISDYDRIQST